MSKRSKKSDKPVKVVTPPPFVATLPTVNLLPAEVVEVLALRRLRRKFIGAGVAVAAAMAALYVGQFAVIANANSDLEQSQGQTQTLNTRMRELAPVRAFYAGVDANQKVIQQTMAHEVLYSGVVRRLHAAAPKGVAITNVSLTAQTPSGTVGADTAAASACPGPDPFNPGTSVGCINITGTAPNRVEVGRFIQQLFADEIFANPYVSATTVDQAKGMAFSATVGLTDKVYSKRYDNVDFLKEASQ